MPGIDELLATFMGQTNTALNAPPAPWQQELLERVNPEKVKRQNIARALAQASTAMATTPGNFLQGVSAAAATGADAYLTGRDEAEDERFKVQQLVQMQQQKDQDRRLSLLMDAIGVNRNQIQDQQSAAESKARTDYYNRRGTAGPDGDGLNANQIRIAKQSILNGLDREEQRLRAGYLDEAQIAERLAEKQAELEDIFGVRLRDEAPRVQSPAPPSPAPQAPAVSGGISAQPNTARDGTIIVNRQTGERMILKDGKWQPL